MSPARRSAIPDDRSLATLTCGGELPAEAFDSLLRAIEKSEASLTVDGAAPEDLDLADLPAGNLVLFSRKVGPGGDLTHLETFCRKHDLTYRRVTRGGAFTETTEAFWCPGMVLPHRFQINAHTGDVLYPMTFLLALRNHKVNLNEWVLSFKKNFPTAIPPFQTRS